MIVRDGASFAVRSNDYSEILITINSQEHVNANLLVVSMRQELPLQTLTSIMRVCL